MKIDIFNIDDFIKANNCKEVTNPVFFDWSGQPTPDGLFSYEIFGVTELERKSIFGYIDLGAHYIHPVIFQLINSRMQALKDILYGRRYAVIADKKIHVVPETTDGADTGIDFLYNHFHEIDWISEFEESEMGSIDKKARLKFLKSLDKDEFFVSKWLVLPAAYRAEDSESKTLGDNVNGIYKDIISKTRSMKVGFSFDLFNTETKMSVQNLITQCYLATLAPASGKNIQPDGTLKGTAKNSMIRKHLLGKTLDYTASNVITAAEVSGAERPEDMPTTFGYSAYPLATLVSLFNPFFVQNIAGLLEAMAISFRERHINEGIYVDIQQFDNDRCEKMIKKFIKSESERNQPVTVEYKTASGEIKEEEILLIDFNSKEEAMSPDANEKGFIHPMTLTDLMFMIANDVLVEKNYHVYVTRYPASEFQNIYPSRIKIKTTAKTKNIWMTPYDEDEKGYMEHMLINYKNYPIIQYPNGPKYTESETRLFNVFNPGNIYLKAMGGDFDGDMMYLKSVFTKEANDEADRLTYAKTNILGASGRYARGISYIGKEATVTLYELTKEG